MPSQHGVHDWIQDGNTGENALEYLQGQIGYTDLLSENGYVCGISGKWHLGDSLKPQKSFSHWYVCEKGGGPYNNPKMVRDGQLVSESGYLTDLITDNAIEFIEKYAQYDQPFYLSIQYTAPHSPWVYQHPKPFLDLYKDCSFESSPIESPHAWIIENPPGYQHSREENLKGYYASISAMDMNIGRVLDKLSQLDLIENTLICFFCDNGMNMEHHGIWGKGNGTFP